MGDLSPIETVWAKLRKDLPAREFEDLKNWENHFQDSLQAKGGAAFDFIFNSRPRGAAFLFGAIGARHAKEAGEVQEKQVWALWQVGGAPKY